MYHHSDKQPLMYDDRDDGTVTPSSVHINYLSVVPASASVLGTETSLFYQEAGAAGVEESKCDQDGKRLQNDDHAETPARHGPCCRFVVLAMLGLVVIVAAGGYMVVNERLVSWMKRTAELEEQEIAKLREQVRSLKKEQKAAADECKAQMASLNETIRIMTNEKESADKGCQSRLASERYRSNRESHQIAVLQNKVQALAWWKFQIGNNGTTTMMIRKLGSAGTKCLDMHFDGGRHSVHVDACRRESNQQHWFAKTTVGSDKKAQEIGNVAAAPGLCLDHDVQHNFVQMYACNGRPNQRWVFDETYHTWGTQQDVTQCLDYDGKKLSMKHCNKHSTQKFGFD